MSAGGQRDWGVVVVNWNTPVLTIACLESILGAEDAPPRVVLVDNASTDGSVATIVQWARRRGLTVRMAGTGENVGDTGAWLTIFEATKPRGFSANNNVGIQYFRNRTRASHVLLLNSDATVAPDFFSKLRSAVAERPDGGLFTGTIYRDPEREVVWYAGGRINPLRALVTHNTSQPESGSLLETPFICGCAMLISRDALEHVGLLAECYDPAYCEDADYSLRAHAAGFALVYAPRAKLYHRVGATAGPTDSNPWITYTANRNRAFLIRRNYRGWRKAAGLGYLIITKPGRALVEALRGRPRTGLAILKGMVAGVTSRAALS